MHFEVLVFVGVKYIAHRFLTHVCYVRLDTDETATAELDHEVDAAANSSNQNTTIPEEQEEEGETTHREFDNTKHEAQDQGVITSLEYSVWFPSMVWLLVYHNKKKKISYIELYL